MLARDSSVSSKSNSISFIRSIVLLSFTFPPGIRDNRDGLIERVSLASMTPIVLFADFNFEISDFILLSISKMGEVDDKDSFFEQVNVSQGGRLMSTTLTDRRSGLPNKHELRRDPHSFCEGELL